jgi:glycosyltransferase 2 family protein
MRKIYNFFLSTTSRITFGIGISVLSFYLAFRTVDLGDLKIVFSNINWVWVGISLIMILIHHFSKAFKWKVLVDQQNIKISFLPLFASLMISQMINLIVPARAGEIIRIQQIGGMGPGRSFILVTLVVEKVFDMAAFGLLFLVLLISISLPQWIHNSGVLFVTLSAFLFTALLLVFKYREDVFKIVQKLSIRLPDKYQNLVLSKLQVMISSLSSIENGRVLRSVLFWTTISWLASVLTNYFVLNSLGLYLSWTAPILILLGLQAGISIPSIPMKIGLFEYICVLILEIYGVSQVSSLSYGILLHLLVLLPILGSGLIFLVGSDKIFKVVKESINTTR